MSAQFGAITGSNESRRRSADVQIRIGSPAEDNTHGDHHRASALTTVPLPLTDDKEALARSLWFATNRGYGRALDSYLKVKTEQQVRAKEEDASADFSQEKPVDAFATGDAKFSPAAPLMTKSEKAAWEGRVRELSGLFKQFPDVFANSMLSWRRRTRTDYFVASDGSKVSTPSHVASAGGGGADAGRGRDGPVPGGDV